MRADPFRKGQPGTERVCGGTDGQSGICARQDQRDYGYISQGRISPKQTNPVGGMDTGTIWLHDDHRSQDGTPCPAENKSTGKTPDCAGSYKGCIGGVCGRMPQKASKRKAQAVGVSAGGWGNLIRICHKDPCRKFLRHTGGGTDGNCDSCVGNFIPQSGGPVWNGRNLCDIEQ